MDQEAITIGSGVFDKAWKVFGEDMNLLMAEEEASELITEIVHRRRGRTDNVIGEAVDSFIMAMTLRAMDKAAFDGIFMEKLKRLHNRVNAGNLNLGKETADGKSE